VLPLVVLAAPVVLVVLVWAWLPQTRADDRVQAV
jgi:hypothetical protein